MKKRAKQLLVAVSCLFLLFVAVASCSSNDSKPASTTQVEEGEEAKQKCDGFNMAEAILENMKASTAEKYDASYFESEGWKAFVDGYWLGFWDQHQHCKECLVNGDVPEVFRK